MPPPAASANDMIGHNGRVRQEMLAAFAAHANPIRFKDTFRHPFLIGKELYEGELQRQPGSVTMGFVRAETVPADSAAAPAAGAVPEDFRGTATESVTRTTYAIRRRSDSKNAPNVVTIGRESVNDLIIAEYTVSGEHATIVIEYGSYYLIDNGSKNGTEVNGKRLVPQQRTKLEGADVVAFGRIAFVFIPVLAMQELLRKQAPARPFVPIVRNG